MHGLGRASAAITIVNALPSGIGCAIGIDLEAVAEATILPSFGEPGTPTVAPADGSSPLVAEAVREALRQFTKDGSSSCEVAVRSAIPVARGLKSSSAVASAVVLAVAQAAGSAPAARQVARLSAEVSRRSGVSATGAYDDALAGLSTGFVVTDNGRDALVRHRPADPRWEVALLVPPGTHPASPGLKDAFRAYAKESRRALDAALADRWWDAMHRNSEIVERVMGYSYASLRTRLAATGAVGSGVSGLGPAYAAVAPSERIPRILEVLAKEEGTVLRVGLRRARTGGVA